MIGAILFRFCCQRQEILNGGLYNNVLGVQAQKGNVSFGLHAAYGFGSNERSNTQVNANVRYNF